MNEEYIDWKSRVLVAEAETLNLKNLCAHHGICTTCGEYYIHHPDEPFATCNCNTSEWYELTEYMKLQDELRKLREQEPVAYVKYKATGGNVGLSWFAIPTQVYYPREGEPLYAGPAERRALNNNRSKTT